MYSIHDYNQQTRHYASDRNEHIERARKALEETMTPARLARGTLAAFQRSVEELQVGLAKLRKENEKSVSSRHLSEIYALLQTPERDRLRVLRETIASRRRTISAAKLQITPSQSSNLQTIASYFSFSPSPSPNYILKDTELLATLSSTIARARSGLVQELVEVFNVVEVGGRPPIGGKAGTKGEWTIGDLILPVPGDMRRKFDICTLDMSIPHGNFSRIPPRPYQRGHNTHNTLSIIAHFLSWNQATFRDYLDRG